jgi:ribose 5-phosphate isomerase A
MSAEEQKRVAADAAVALVEPGMVVGLGTGSTAAYAIDALIRRVAAGLDIVAIPTSERSAAQALAGGIRLTDFAENPEVDLTIDGADEISPGLDLVKGLGGALLREKIVAAASRRLVIVADDSKLVPRLGSKAPVPVEVVPFGWQSTAARLVQLGAQPTLRETADRTPFRTDGGNLILDCAFHPIADPAALELAIARVVGVVESGLFVGMANLALVAGAAGVRRLERS